jgi:Sporulation and spore germination
MKKEDILLGGAAAACVALLITALVLRQTPGSSGSSTAAIGAEGPEGAPAEAGGAGVAPSGPVAAAPEGQAAATPEGGAASPEAAGSPSPEEPSFISEQNRRDVLLFFAKGDGDGLGTEKRKIFLTVSPADQAKQIVGELINGPRETGLLPTLPVETRLLGLYLDRHGTAYVDLSEELVTLHPGGSDEEIATIFSLVDSLTYNLPEIKRVHLLIGGEERDTLKSHLDLRRDYRQDLSIADLPERQQR